MDHRKRPLSPGAPITEETIAMPHGDLAEVTVETLADHLSRRVRGDAAATANVTALLDFVESGLSVSEFDSGILARFIQTPDVDTTRRALMFTLRRAIGADPAFGELRAAAVGSVDGPAATQRDRGGLRSLLTRRRAGRPATS
jgi:hypothetical protein